MSTEAPPERIWIQVYGAPHDGIMSATKIDPREVHDNGKPVYEYVRVHPHPESQEVARAIIDNLSMCGDPDCITCDHCDEQAVEAIASALDAARAEK